MINIEIIIQSIKIKFKDYKTLIMLSLFPLVLTTLFVNVFAKVEDVDFGETHLIIESKDVELGKAYIDMLDEMNKQEVGLQIYYEEIPEGENGEAVLKEKKADFLIRIQEDAKAIELVKGVGRSFQEGLIKEITNSFISQRAIMNKVLESEDIDNIEDLLSIKPEQIYSHTVTKGEKGPSIILTLTVTMIIFGALLGGQYVINQIFYIKEPVGRRIVTGPIKESTLYLNEFIASILMIFGTTLILTLLYSRIFELGLERNLGATIWMIFLLTLVAGTMGMVIGVIVPSKSVGENILSLVIIVISFMSGGFTPGIEIGIAAKLIPAGGIMNSLIEIGSTGQVEKLGEVTLSTLLICTVLLIVAVWCLNKKGDRQNGKCTQYSKA